MHIFAIYSIGVYPLSLDPCQDFVSVELVILNVLVTYLRKSLLLLMWC